jgi:hypothetical protein
MFLSRKIWKYTFKIFAFIYDFAWNHWFSLFIIQNKTSTRKNLKTQRQQHVECAGTVTLCIQFPTCILYILVWREKTRINKEKHWNEREHALPEIILLYFHGEILLFFSQVGYLSNVTANIKFIHCRSLSPSWNAHIMTATFLVVVCESVSIRQRFQ